MKRIVLFSVIGVIVFALSSCKKDWSCTCKDSVVGAKEYTVANYTNMKRSSAQIKCYAFEHGNNYSYYATTCAIK